MISPQILFSIYRLRPETEILGQWNQTETKASHSKKLDT